MKKICIRCKKEYIKRDVDNYLPNTKFPSSINGYQNVELCSKCKQKIIDIIWDWIRGLEDD
jgi:hypothetical protein